MEGNQPAGGVRSTEIVAAKEQVAALAPRGSDGFFAVQAHAVFVFVVGADVVAFVLRTVADAREAFAGVCIDGIVPVQGLCDERVLGGAGVACFSFALLLFDLGDVVGGFCGGCGQRDGTG